MQKIGAQYLLKKVTDTVMPAKEDAPVAEAQVIATPSRPDTIEVHDDEGNLIGTAHRVDVAVYAVTYGRGRPESALARSLEEENTRVMVQRSGSRISSIIYVPDPNGAPRGEATRADDI
jgi:hypothetical protein